MHFMESASRVEYARTLAGVVVLDAIKTARDVLAATGADYEQLNQEVDWTLTELRGFTTQTNLQKIIRSSMIGIGVTIFKYLRKCIMTRIIALRSWRRSLRILLH